MNTLRILSLFSGIGAFEKALTRLNIPHEIVGFSEIDKYAIASYCAIHNVSMDKWLGDITKIDPHSLPQDIDLLTHGSPCQSFSIAGKGSGGDKGSNTKSSLMWYSVEIIRYVKPKYVIWENVKNVLSKQHRHNFDQYIKELEEIGYHSYYKVLNSCDYGIPQNRERIFVISILGEHEPFNFPEPFDSGLRLKDLLETEVEERFYIDTTSTREIITNLQQELLAQTPNKMVKVGNIYPSKGQNGTVYHENGISGTLSAGTGDKGNGIGSNNAPKILTTINKTIHQGTLRRNNLNEMIENYHNLLAKDESTEEPTEEPTAPTNTNRLIQEGNLMGGIWNKTLQSNRRYYSVEGLAPTIQTCGGGNIEPKIIVDEVSLRHERTKYGKAYNSAGINEKIDNVLLITKPNYCVRKLIPLECWRLMGFDEEDYQKARAIPTSYTQLYKQAGNSIVVNVLEEICKSLFKL